MRYEINVITNEKIELSDAPILPQLEPTIPTIVTMRQARLALYEAGLLDRVATSLVLLPIEEQRKKAQIEWEYSTTVDRNSALVFGLSKELGLTESMLDNLFIKASSL